MKKLNKKGFTIVELVIVIAVIAILAAVLIPTFSNVVDKANESTALQEARAALTGVISMNKQGQVVEGTAFLSGDKTFYYKNSKLDAENEGTVDKTPASIVMNNEYFTLDASNTYATAFANLDAAKKVFAALGYTLPETLTSKDVKGYATNNEEIKSQDAMIVSYKLADDLYIAVPKTNVYNKVVAEGATNDATIIMEAGHAYVTTTELSDNPTAAPTGTSFKLLFNSDFSKNVIVVIPNAD